MTQHAEGRLLPEAAPAVDRGIREQIDATSQAVAAADQAYLLDAIGSVSWERRGLLQRLTRRPRPSLDVVMSERK
jgi:hypothetical protein